MKHEMAGKMSVEYWVFCDCGNDQILVDNVPHTGMRPETLAEASEVARQVHNWELVRGRRWTCPACNPAKAADVKQGE